VPAAISAADELKRLWASSSTKDAFRRQNIQQEFVPATVREYRGARAGG
jgi:hypothetical protein